ncbi:MAG: hypothetical protein K8R99_07975 [Actinomycetia bacterium]|nr:hypothetical protein [Actinomycetes bacterium]
MRDAFGEIDPDEIDIIDLIEFDADAFPADRDADRDEAKTTAQPEQTKPSHRRRRLIAAAVTGVIGLAAAGLVAWSPWTDDDESLSFPDGDAPELSRTAELVFDDLPAPLTAASLGSGTTDDSGFGSLGAGEGYFFAEPGAGWSFDAQTNGTWVAFLALPEGDESAPDMTVDDGETTATVQGAPAVISSNLGFREISFGPSDGLMFSVVSSGLSLAESLAFAEAVGVDGGVPIVRDDTVIGSMLPVGDVADYSVATGTVFAAISAFGEMPGTVSVHYGDFLTGAAYSIASRAAVSESTLAMVRFVLGADEERRVHGQPAIAVDQPANMFGGAAADMRSIVAWVEGGRLIIVCGPDDVEATLALAETVREATDNEWAEVVEVAQNSVDPSIPLFPVDESTTLYRRVDPATGDTLSLTAEWADGSLTTCIQVQSDAGSSAECSNASDAALPLLTLEASNGRRFVLAIIDRGQAADSELRITLADGNVETIPLEDESPDLPGPAVATLLPEDHGAIELWVGDERVATL